MRTYRMRWDLWWSLVLTGALVMLISWLATMAVGKMDFSIAPVAQGLVGSVATAETPRVGSIEEIKAQNEPFTIEISKYAKNEFAQNYDGFRVITLPSSERVLARINHDSTQKIEDIEVLPMGVMSAEAPKTKESVAGEKTEITDDTFYVDMGGEEATTKRILAPTAEGTLLTIQLVSVIPSWLLVRFAGVRIGAFPPIFGEKTKRNKNEEE